MFTLSKAVVLFSLALSATCLTTPHLARSPHHHHALAARRAPAIPEIHEPSPQLASSPARQIRRRRSSSHCKSQPWNYTETSSPAPDPTFDDDFTNPDTSSSSLPDDTKTPKPTSTQSQPSGAPTGGDGASFYFSGVQSGKATYYAAGLGACGITNKDSDMITAVSAALFDGYPGYNGINPNTNPICGQPITLWQQGYDTKITVRVTDRCVGCVETGLDLTNSSFAQLADLSKGVIPIEWEWGNLNA